MTAWRGNTIRSTMIPTGTSTTSLTWRAVKPYLPRDAMADMCRPWLRHRQMGNEASQERILRHFRRSFRLNDRTNPRQDRGDGLARQTRYAADRRHCRSLDDRARRSISLSLAMGDPLSICTDALAAAREMYRITKPGGVVIASADNKLKAALPHFIERGNLDAAGRVCPQYACNG